MGKLLAVGSLLLMGAFAWCAARTSLTDTERDKWRQRLHAATCLGIVVTFLFPYFFKENGGSVAQPTFIWCHDWLAGVYLAPLTIFQAIAFAVAGYGLLKFLENGNK